jgi:hypothetical protein
MPTHNSSPKDILRLESAPELSYAAHCLNRQAIPKKAGNLGLQRISLVAVLRVRRECFPASRELLGHAMKERSI